MFVIKDDQLLFAFRGKEVPVTVSYHGKEKLDIRVTPEQKIFVKVPSSKKLMEIKTKLDLKINWIFRQLDFFESHATAVHSTSFASGCSFRLLGYDHLVMLEFGQHGKVEMAGKFINLFLEDPNDSKTAQYIFNKWKKQKALEVIAPIYDRCFGMIHKYEVEWTPFKFKKMNNRWGSCTSEGIIYLNPELIAFPTHLIEYAVLHELCHLVHRSHDAKFYKLVSLIMPDWREREIELKAT
ncbi:MAG: SprT family zinc-dependent metalloprotease [Bdellovibrionota bacterium]